VISDRKYDFSSVADSTIKERYVESFQEPRERLIQSQSDRQSLDARSAHGPTSHRRKLEGRADRSADGFTHQIGGTYFAGIQLELPACLTDEHVDAGDHRVQPIHCRLIVGVEAKSILFVEENCVGGADSLNGVVGFGRLFTTSS
jgi:hypothetical protein